MNTSRRRRSYPNSIIVFGSRLNSVRAGRMARDLENLDPGRQANKGFASLLIDRTPAVERGLWWNSSVAPAREQCVIAFPAWNIRPSPWGRWLPALTGLLQAGVSIYHQSDEIWTPERLTPLRSTSCPPSRVVARESRSLRPAICSAKKPTHGRFAGLKLEAGWWNPSISHGPCASDRITPTLHPPPASINL